MSTTIFCTFDQQDLADLAIGKLRDSVLGIKSIHYVSGFNSSHNILNRSAAHNSIGVFGAQDTLPEFPSRPVTVRIVCSSAAAPVVKSRLINLHAYEIITTA